MNTIAGKEKYLPTWVNSIKFDTLWKKSNFYLFIEKWEGEPKDIWFTCSGKKMTGFISADVQLSNDKKTVNFLNGRHRTRWQLQRKKPMIPIGLTEEGFKEAHLLGLEPERVSTVK